jgi:phosphoglycolate phosphatase-like HAD superfamily hydrolase
MAEKNPLHEFEPKHEFFVGLDSDGCVFDSMEIKHKECFTPAFVRHWELQAAAKYAREVWEFANLYSVHRGMNRFPVLIKSLELLLDWPDAVRRGITIPDLQGLRDFVESGLAQSNSSLEQFAKQRMDPVLLRTLEWSYAVNNAVADIVKGVPPFPKVRACLDRIVARADLAVVSGTPGEALRREWEEHRIDRYPALIAGQELGKKSEHLSAMTKDARYKQDHMLMIGDAPGDLKAARATGMLFYPVNPGHEEESWQRLHDEALDLFFSGAYAGEYERARVAEFERLLPEKPRWKR